MVFQKGQGRAFPGVLSRLAIVALLAHSIVIVCTYEFTRCEGFLWRYFEEAVNWQMASLLCTKMGAQLAVANTTRRLQCVKDTLPADRSDSLRLWVGATHLVQEDEYRWVTGDWLDGTFGKGLWRSGEPSNKDTPDEDEHCVYSYPDEAGRLGDRACSQKHPYVCQKSISTSVVLTTLTSQPTTSQTAATSRESSEIPLSVSTSQTPPTTEPTIEEMDDLTSASAKPRPTPVPSTFWRTDASTSAQFDDIIKLHAETPIPSTETTAAGENHPKSGTTAAVSASKGVPLPVVVALSAAFLLILVVVAVVARRKSRTVVKVAVGQAPTDEEGGLPGKTLKTQFNNMSYNSQTLQVVRGLAHLKPANDYETVGRGTDHCTLYCNEYYDDDELIGYCRLFEPPATTESGIYQQLADNRYCHLVREHVIIGDQLGAGHFANVFAGVWTKMGVTKQHVAIKTLKKGASKDSRVKFLQEAAIMGQFRHRNVVQLYGVVAQGEPILLVLELMSKDLRAYLLSCITPPPNTQELFLGMAHDIACGMAYLGAKGFVHRDLAARNVMIDSNGVCKIGDFGMSRDLANEDYYFSQGGKVPVKWTAPEAITFRQYSTASDVWSYGIVLYEIYEFGRKPYLFWSNEKVFEEVQAGYRLPKPQHCPSKVYSLMMQCWLLDKNDRPTFLQVLQELEGVKEYSLPTEGSSL